MSQTKTYPCLLYIFPRDQNLKEKVSASFSKAPAKPGCTPVNDMTFKNSWRCRFPQSLRFSMLCTTYSSSPCIRIYKTIVSSEYGELTISMKLDHTQLTNHALPLGDTQQVGFENGFALLDGNKTDQYSTKPLTPPTSLPKCWYPNSSPILSWSIGFHFFFGFLENFTWENLCEIKMFLLVHEIDQGTNDL